MIENNAPDGYLKQYGKHWDYTIGKYNNSSTNNGDTSTAQIFNTTIENIKANISLSKVEYLARNLQDEKHAEITRDTLGYNKNNANIVKNGKTFDIVKPLEGAVFELQDERGTVIESNLTTGKDGLANITSMLNENSTYYLHEITAPDGYLKIETPLSFRLSDYSKTPGFNGNIILNVANNKDTGKIVISKIDKYSNELILDSKAEFSIEKLRVANNGETNTIEHNGTKYVYDNNFKETIIKTGLNNALAIVDNLEFGIYVVREIKSPNGYILDKNPRIVEINKNRANQTIMFKNASVKSGIEIKKYINDKDANNPNDACRNKT